MKLSPDDLQAIRQLLSEELTPLGRRMTTLEDEVKTLADEVKALGNDVKEIYNILVYNGLKVIID